MKILIFGGTGAMGIPLVKYLSVENEVWVTTRRPQQEKTSCVNYIIGNAHDNAWVQEILKEKFDVLIDFMLYSTKEFEKRLDMLLSSVKHYIFLSSSRVYANSIEKIKEGSDRLYDVTNDLEFLASDEYAIAKARQEDLLLHADSRNWTIIRPYITYNTERFQLGFLEKEYWLQRAIDGKTIVFSKDIAEKYTTLTWGDDVSYRIAMLVGKQEAYGEIYHITCGVERKWSDILEIYVKCIFEISGKKPKVIFTENSKVIAFIMGKQWQVKYDRLYNRRFDNTKINNMCHSTDMAYIDVEKGIKKCLEDFYAREDKKYRDFYWKSEAYFDKVAGEHTKLTKFGSAKEGFKYFICRYTPFIWFQMKIKNRK